MLIKAWMMAIRLKSLPIPTIQVLTAITLAYAFTGRLHGILAICTWLVALFVTIGMNLINDVFDHEKGGDTVHRVGPIKVIRAGYLTKSQVLAAGLLAFGLTLVFSVPLIMATNWWIFFIVLLSIACGYCYTAGPYPISYLGLSEVFVFLFYGGVCVISSFFIQTGFFNPAVILLAAQMGMLAILPNALNNFRDVVDDAQAGKITLAVRFGTQFARREILFMTFAPFILNLGWFFLGSIDAALMPLLSLPLAIFFGYGVWTSQPGAILNYYFGLGVLVHFLFGLLLIIGFLLT